MIPILYESNETLFASNGLGRLRDVIECKVVEERNGIYECDFSYPVTGAHYDEIIEGRIVGVTHDDTGNIQPFDIVSRNETIDGIVTFHCTHISYRQTKMVTWGTGINSLADAFQCFETTCRPEGNPFNYVTDKDSTGFVASFDGTPRSIRSILGGVEGSILDTYGGEYEWDKWTVRLHSARGVQRDFTIRYGVNLTDYENDSDSSEVFNTCVPYWKDSDGNVVNGGLVSSGRSTIGSGDKCVPLDLSDKFDTAPSVVNLQSMAQSYMTSNQTFAPSQNIKVSFARIQDEAGFDQFDALLRCQLCDSIRVLYPLYNLSAYYKIVKTTWDVLLDRYESMELGALSTTLAEALGLSNSGNYTGSGDSGEPLLKVAVVQCNGNGATYQSFNVTPISGYTAIGIVGYKAFGDARVTNSMCDMHLEISEQKIYITNYSYAFPSGTGANVDVLYARADAV